MDWYQPWKRSVEFDSGVLETSLLWVMETKKSLFAWFPVPSIRGCESKPSLLSSGAKTALPAETSLTCCQVSSVEKLMFFWLLLDYRPLRKDLDIGSDTDVTQSSMEDINRTICDHRSPTQKHFSINQQQQPPPQGRTGAVLHPSFSCTPTFLIIISIWSFPSITSTTKKVGQERPSRPTANPKQREFFA